MKRDPITTTYDKPPAFVADCSRAPDSRESLDRAAHAALARLSGGLSPAALCLAVFDWAQHFALAPGKWIELTAQLAQDNTTAPLPVSGDPRFAAASWNGWPYCVWRDGFLRLQQWCESATTGVRGVERHHEDVVRFGLRQMLDALSPSNFVLTNPAVIEETLRTGGANFVAGSQHWIEDLTAMLARAPGKRQPGAQAFMPGRDVAITPGKVVYRNDLCELIQYSPSTDTVAREPVFIVPSWIMKYYILDLSPHDSLVRYLVSEGFTVFMISWRNPGPEDRDLALNDYLSRGVLDALAEVRKRCDATPVHAVGYCLGGTLLSIAAAMLARDARADELRSVTLLAAQTDFTEPGELGLFIDASELATLDALMWEQGFLDGSQMAAAFQLLNARDLIWSRLMSEYLLGRRSKPNDLMAWNADTTRMPYRMHSEYLTQLFLRNDLAEGRYCVDGRPVALSDIEQPMFVVGTEQDHVSPWRSVYKLHLLTHNPLTFLLTAGGHNAGIVSEPGHAGRHYRCGTRSAGASYRSRHAFFNETEPTEGSWWPRWSQWLHEQSDVPVPRRLLDDALPDAPGTYVRQS
ncbi:PHA/PHB synthase family protein [Caballeronia sp. DA-9]|uniref:PHA/PHB synthase family protein n=1 Tax=Caballeronia sp. DA-9 TaxID=3436237 RepID=UPI003F666B0A